MRESILVSLISKPIIPKEHGAWVALLIPMFIGALAYPPERYNYFGGLILAVSAILGIFFTEPLRLLLSKGGVSNRLRLYLWASIYFAGSLLPLAWMAYFFDLWGLAWFGIPVFCLVALKLFAGVAKIQRTALMEITGALGLAISALAAFYVQHGALLPESLILYALSGAWSAQRTIITRLMLSRLRSAKRSPSEGNGGQILIKGIISHIAVLLFVALILVFFGDRAPWTAFLPYLLVSFRDAGMIVFNKYPNDPHKLGFAEMRLGIAFGLFIALAWRFDY